MFHGKPLKNKIHHFLEESQSQGASAVRNFILVLIFLSAGFAILQLMEPTIFDPYTPVVEKIELGILAIFTLEILLRAWSTPNQKRFWNSTVTWVDLLSVVPFYFGISNTVILRLFRAFRLFRLSRRGMLDFLDRPETPVAITIRFLIIILIVLSSGFAFWQLVAPESIADYNRQIEIFETVALAIFTVELAARFFASRSLIQFLSRPANWIDILAVVPFYFGIQNAVLLRMFRIFRVLKIFSSFSILRTSEIFDFRNSILRVVTPLIIVFIFLKGFVWIMEVKGAWISETDFGTLFTIIGFSLGVVLSQKIGKSYSKYLAVQEGMYSLHGKLMVLQTNLNIMSPGAGDKIIYDWLRGFLDIYHGDYDLSVSRVRAINREMSMQAMKIGNTDLIPFHRMAAMMSSAQELAIVIQSKCTNRVPITYNLLLQQTIIIYLLLLVVFIPGGKGMISVIFAGYLLYGLFQITDDFDHVAGKPGAGNLIIVDAVRITRYLRELEEINKK